MSKKKKCKLCRKKTKVKYKKHWVFIGNGRRMTAIQRIVGCKSCTGFYTTLEVRPEDLIYIHSNSLTNQWFTFLHKIQYND